eukprot:scaffold11759_cov41-Phaeocystis_antarctica.AAC.1
MSTHQAECHDVALTPLTRLHSMLDAQLANTRSYDMHTVEVWHRRGRELLKRPAQAGRASAVVERQVQEACRARAGSRAATGRGIGGLRVRSHRHRQGGQAGRVADGKGDVGARDAGARHKPASGHAQEPTR